MKNLKKRLKAVTQTIGENQGAMELYGAPYLRSKADQNLLMTETVSIFYDMLMILKVRTKDPAVSKLCLLSIVDKMVDEVNKEWYNGHKAIKSVAK